MIGVKYNPPRVTCKIERCYTTAEEKYTSWNQWDIRIRAQTYSELIICQALFKILFKSNKFHFHPNTRRKVLCTHFIDEELKSRETDNLSQGHMESSPFITSSGQPSLIFEDSMQMLLPSQSLPSWLLTKRESGVCSVLLSYLNLTSTRAFITLHFHRHFTELVVSQHALVESCPSDRMDLCAGESRPCDHQSLHGSWHHGTSLSPTKHSPHPNH